MRTLAALLWRDDDTTAARPAAPRLAAWAALAAGGIASGVLAQGSVPCTAIDNDAERLACYDRALRPNGAPPAAAPSVAAPAPSTAPAAAAAPTLGTSDRRSERRIRESTATAAPTAPVAAPAAPTRGIFADSDAIVPLVIVSVRALPGREATFTDDEGTRWVQTDGQRLSLPDAPFDAELKPGAMGSFFLIPKDRGRGVRVRQVR